MTPDQEAIASFKEFTACHDDAIAVRALKANPNVEAAIGSYFENPEQYFQDPPAEQWDDTLWSQGRYGPDPDPNAGLSGPGIVIQGPDDFPRSSAPTRPPSRTSNIADVGLQETGVVGSNNDSAISGKYFGPATRDAYPDSQWAMTLTSIDPTVSSLAVFPDVLADSRRRASWEPGFVKPDSALEHAPALLSILGQIPQVLKCFLEHGTILDDYGFDADWWKGSAITRPLTTDLESSDPETDRERQACDDALHELHRVVAFFVASNRAYYADGGLFKLFRELRDRIRVDEEAWRGVGETLTSSFTEGWISAAEIASGSPHPAALFESRVVEFSDGQVTRDIPFSEWDLKLPDRFPDSNVSIYDILDDTVWDLDADGTNTAGYWLEKVPHILILTIKNHNVAAKDLDGIDIPPTLYLDRYLKENVDITKGMRKRASTLRTVYARIRERRKRIVTFKHPKAKSDDVEILFNSTVKFLQASDSQKRNEEDEDVSMGEAKDIPYANSELLQMLDALQTRVRAKLRNLETEQAKILDEMKALTGLLKAPSSSGPDPTARYTLSGIAVSEEEMFVRCPPRNEEEVPNWWHIQYTSAPSIERSCVDEREVIHAAQWSSAKVMFVYASDEILKPVDLVLPPSLQAFIDTDNNAFGKEEYEEWERQQLQPARDQPPPYDFDANSDFVPDKIGADANSHDFYDAQPHGLPDPETSHNFANSSSVTWAEYYQAPAPGGEQDYVLSDNTDNMHLEKTGDHKQTSDFTTLPSSFDNRWE